MRLEPFSFDDLPGWSAAEAAAVWPVFIRSCAAILEKRPPLRGGTAPDGGLVDICRKAVAFGPSGSAETFIRRNFRPYLVTQAEQAGFVTGYYEPEVEGSLTETSEFGTPALSRPTDLVDMRDVAVAGWDHRLEGARRNPDGTLSPYPARAEIERGAAAAFSRPLVWLRDPVELFYAQVQGSARVRFPDGAVARLVYDGRNGRPYTSIGRILIERGEIAPDEMSMRACRDWLHRNGLELGQPGRDLLHRNESYVFFRIDAALTADTGPVGAQGLSLTPLRSLAVDRRIWPYGTPVWIEGDFSDAGLGVGPSGRLMIAQDTGSAIVGPARGDLFIGSGAAAGEIAGRLRHAVKFVVFAPRETSE